MSHDTETKSPRSRRLFLLVVALIVAAIAVVLYAFDGWDVSSIAVVVVALLLGALIIGRFLAIVRYELM